MSFADATDFEQVDPQILLGFPELVAELGGDGDSLLKAVEIDPLALRDGQAAVTCRQMAELVGTAATRLQCPDFGMQLAQRQTKAINTPLLQTLRSSRNLGEAIDHVIGHSFAHSRAAAIWVERCPHEGEVKIGHDILIEGVPDTRQAIEQILLIEYLTRLEATTGFARARRVEFRHLPVASRARYRTHFRCEALFGRAADCIVYDEKILMMPIATPNPVTRGHAMAQIRATHRIHKPPLHISVRGYLLHRLGRDACSNLDVAAALELHPRTLHRGLQREGTSFQRVKDRVRSDLLTHYLNHSNLSLSEISCRLGFSEQSAMTRFCRQWLGFSPRVWRRKMEE